MNAPRDMQEMFSSLILPVDVSGLDAIGGDGVPQFISTSRTDKEVVALLNHHFYEAADTGASDIHFQSDEYGVMVRYRLGGVLTDLHRISREAGKEVDSKLRARCKVSAVDRETPLDGSFWLIIGGLALDVRVNFLPTRFGQNIACRLLDQRNASRRLDDIEMPMLVRAMLMSALQAPEGIILVTGPTGSGKTSTLYACLNELNTRSVHIVTAEDPIEYRLPGADQACVHPNRTFAQILRAFLRQDFDIGLVGEIRDMETATIAYQAANTGHLILSTLHANDTIASVTRLGDLGVDPYTVQAATKCIIAQRLPQRLCPRCKVPHTLNDHEQRLLDRVHYDGHRTFWTNNPDGCEACLRGQKGRMPVIEMLGFTKELRDALVEGQRSLVKEAAKLQPQFVPLLTTALCMSVNGLVGFNQAIALGGQ